jgi:hypothetical protein
MTNAIPGSKDRTMLNQTVDYFSISKVASFNEWREAEKVSTIDIEVNV